MSPNSSLARLAILGIGHELRGDDAAGLEVARRLQPFAAHNPHLLVIETGPVPENFTGLLRRFAPGRVILVDAVQMGEPPGTLRFLNWRDAVGLPSTHTFPLNIFADYLVSEFSCAVELLGIQPGDNAFNAPLTAEVEQAVEQASRYLQTHFISAS